ncbi:MAG TPA: sigma-54 factor interaction domain-containing protein, partial [Candidatus Latescibacteria bacterium]|nr:sigma-54 factor interaction domain-containing protein [Candidatus Latescibacterota bacterium]
MGRGVNQVDFTILVVSQDEELRRAVVSWFEGQGGHVVLSEGGRLASVLVRRGNVDLVIWDGEVEESPEEICREAKRHYPKGIVLWVSGGDPPRWVQVDGVLERPVRREEVERFLGRIEERRRFLSENGLIGRSEAMQDVFETALEVASTDVQVLLTGENGTGKDVLAKAIHNHSPRREKPFIPVNCGAIPESLMESELFGYERGAFTGATGRRIGVFEAADGGTLFLDEVGEMPLSAQVKLLRVLDDKKIMRVGGREQIPVDVRVLAATNRDLRQEVLEGNFRRDLYYRL